MIKLIIIDYQGVKKKKIKRKKERKNVIHLNRMVIIH